MEQGLDSELERGPLEYEIDDFDAVLTEWGYMDAYPKCGDDSSTGENASSFTTNQGHEGVPWHTRLFSMCTSWWTTCTWISPFYAVPGEQERLACSTAEMEFADDPRGGRCADGGC